jgi:hypothetical protein
MRSITHAPAARIVWPTRSTRTPAKRPLRSPVGTLTDLGPEPVRTPVIVCKKFTIR